MGVCIEGWMDDRWVEGGMEGWMDNSWMGVCFGMDGMREG